MKSLPRRLLTFFCCLYCLSVAVVLYLGYRSTVSEFQSYIDDLMAKEAHELVRILNKDGEDALLRELDMEIDELGAQDWVFLYRAPGGKRYVSKNEASWRAILDPISKEDFGILQDGPLTIEAPLLVRFSKLSLGSGSEAYIVVGSTLRTLDRLERTFVRTGIYSLVLLTGLAVFGTLVVMRRVLARIDRISRAANSIQANDPVQRLPMDGSGDEFDLLSCSMNHMLQRIQDLRKAFQITVEYLAHDLRTPLTRMRGSAELALRGKGLTELPALVIEESDGLIEMINTTLEIAAIEAIGQREAGEILNLREIVEEALELFRPVAETKRISISLEIVGDVFTIRGRREQIQRAIANVIDNAIKFCGEGAKVSVLVCHEHHHVVFEVSDTGPGIPEHLLSRVGERFFRSPIAGNIAGYGLGLAFVKATVSAHAGSLELRSAAGRGTTVRVVLPTLPIGNTPAITR